MDQVAAVIHQHPFRIMVAFNAQGMLAKLLELHLDFIRDGLNLAGVGAAAYNEVIGERRNLAQVEGYYVARLLGFSGSGGGEPELLRRWQLLGLAQV